ncbi:hypothetical protein MHYP_G00350440 [Metynnis hypsauchen]
MPDVGLFLLTFFIWHLCNKLLRPPPINDHEHSIQLSDTEDDETSDSEYEEESDRSCSDSSEESKAAPATSPQFVQKLIVFAAGLRLLLSTVMNAAGKVVVTILLGLAGIALPSLTSALYFGAFLSLVWCWVLDYSIDLLLFSTLCLMMTIFSGGHILILYLYQLPLFQQLVPPQDLYARLFGMTAFIHTNASEPYSLGLQADPVLMMLNSSWQDRNSSRLNSFPSDNGYPRCLSLLPYTQDECSYGSYSGVHTHTLVDEEEVSCERDDDTLDDVEPLSSSEPSALTQLGQAIMRQSYISALIIMMVWSITYNSWFTFAMLVWSCVIWMSKCRRQYTMLSAPFLAAYCTLLLVAGFISSLCLHHDELFPTLPERVLVDFDLYGYKTPCLHLGAKTIYAFNFWMLLRQQLIERQQEQQQKEENLQEFKIKTDEGEPSRMVTILGAFIKGTLVKYWILCCCSMFFIISFSGKVVVYKILYICLFLFCVVLYQVHYEVWRCVLKYFWAVVVGYSMLVLILIYMYQFKTVSSLFRQIIGMSEEGLRDLGLEQFDMVELFAQILLPAAFLLACILQLHYFNSDFLSLTDLQNVPVRNGVTRLVKEQLSGEGDDLLDSLVSEPSEDTEGEEPVVNKWLLVVDRISELILQILMWLNRCQEFCWRLLELHSLKLVATGIIWVSLKENHLLILGLLVFDVTVHRHQLYHRLHNDLKTPPKGAIFQNVTWQHLDHGVLPCLKYFCNYFFYKFGLEMSFVVAVNVIGQRMDFYAILHSFALIAVLGRRRRKAIGEMWPKYCCFTASLMVFQYLLCIGLPPTLCTDYPWRKSTPAFTSNLIKWLYLPDFAMQPNPTFILYDFLLLMAASLQWQVFEDENKASVRLLAGENVEISRSLNPRSLNQYTSIGNFLHCRSYLDMAKVFVFSYFFWLVLCLVFITGTTRINIFCLGYLVACFYFMLFGDTVLLQPVRYILKLWDCLIAYTSVVICLKNLISADSCKSGDLENPKKRKKDSATDTDDLITTPVELGSCAYLDSLLKNGCWLIQAFSMFCTIKGYDVPEPDDECELPAGEAGIVWDAICFAALLAQRRIFLSYYFLYVVSDLRNSKILASRGAELFEAKVRKRVAARLELEKKSVKLLKKQMEKIKSKQKSQPANDPKQKSDTEPKGEGEEEKWWKPWVSHPSVWDSCGYRLFESDSEEEECGVEEKKEEESAPKKKSALQLAYKAWVAGSKAALRGHEREEAHLRRVERMKAKRELRREQGIETAESSEDELDEPSPEPEEEEKEHIYQRIFDFLRFSWIFLLSLIDDLTAGFNSFCKDNLDISKVLHLERALLSQQQNKGREVTHDSILQFYQTRLSRQSTQILLDEELAAASASQPPLPATPCGYAKLKTVNSKLSWSSSVSSCLTEETMLMSRQPTQDDVDEPCSASPKIDQHISQPTAQQPRRKLLKCANVDMTSFDQESHLPDHEEPSAVSEEDEEAEDEMDREWENKEEEEEEEEEENESEEQEDDHFEKKHVLLKSLLLDSLAAEPKRENIPEPQALSQETRALTASELLLNK